MSEKPDLEERVRQFRTLSLPGQEISMHMGTSYLVNDLMREVTRLQGEIENARCLAYNSIPDRTSEDAKSDLCEQVNDLALVLKKEQLKVKELESQMKGMIRLTPEIMKKLGLSYT
jgi:hypothetical protein